MKPKEFPACLLIVCSFVCFCVLMVPSISSAQQARMWSFGPASTQSTLRDPELNQKAAGITEPQRDVPLRGINGIAWGTDVRFLRGVKHVNDADLFGGVSQYLLNPPLTHLEKIPVDNVLFGFWNGMFCSAVVNVRDLQKYLAFKHRFTSIFGPPYIEKNGEAEKCSWKAKYAIILMRYDGPKGKITIWSDEVYQKIAALYPPDDAQSQQ